MVVGAALATSRHLRCARVGLLAQKGPAARCSYVVSPAAPMARVLKRHPSELNANANGQRGIRSWKQRRGYSVVTRRHGGSRGTPNRPRGTKIAAYDIRQSCIGVKDKSCADVCRVTCIYIDDDGIDWKRYTHPDECIECGACAPECPVTAIFQQEPCPRSGPSSSTWTDGGQPDAAAENAVRARIDELQPSAVEAVR
jgi:NAD-dependent dihydropyrimidine dehydrogenase PreA subunit